jgi:hypothetical protein
MFSSSFTMSEQQHRQWTPYKQAEGSRIGYLLGRQKGAEAAGSAESGKMVRLMAGADSKCTLRESPEQRASIPPI